jgi:hypothetical protein
VYRGIDILEACHQYEEIEHMLPYKVRKVLESLCEEGKYESPFLKIWFFNGSFYGSYSKSDDAFVLETLGDLEDFLSFKML